MPTQDQSEKEFTFKDYFVPLTTSKAIHILTLIGLVVYANSLFNGFVGDDNGQILTNPLIHSLSNIGLFFQGSTLFIEQVGQSAGLYYRPMLSTTFAIIYSMFGANAFPFHLFQLILHITNSILIFLLFRKHFKQSASFFLSLIFLIHPINNEAVVYIANMQEELFAFYGLLALNLLGFKRGFYAVPMLLFLSLLSKETGIIFLPLTMLYYFFFIKRTKQKTQFLIYSIISVIAAYTLLRVFIGNIGINTQFLYMSANATFLERIYTIPSLIIYYLKGVFFPVSLAFGWYWVIKEPTFVNFGIPLIISIFFLGILFLSFLSIKKSTAHFRLFVFFSTLFLLSTGMILQIFPLDLTVADRWFYMPLFGLLGICGVLFDNYHKKLIVNKNSRILGMSALVLVLIFFAGRDIVRNTNWTDSYTLCKHDVNVNTESYILEFCLSNELYNRKDYKNAQIHAQKAVELYPEYFLSWYTLGKIHYVNNDQAKAREAFAHALQYNDFALGSEELALIYVYERNTMEARKITDMYLKKLPNSAQLWYAKALTEYVDGNSSEATAAAKKAYDLQPTSITEKVYMRLSNNLPIKF